MVNQCDVSGWLTSRAIVLALLWISFPVCAQLPEGIVDTQPGKELPPTPEESLQYITIPEGFHVSLFAGEPDVAQPIAINYDDKGRLWVLESFSYIEWKRTGKDRLLIFEDTDNDGQFDTRKVFWNKGNHTSGFQIGFGGVWLCDAPELIFIPDADGDDIPDAEPQVVLDGWTTKAEHNFVNGLNWGPDGWLYGRHGIKQPSKVGKPGTPDEERTDLSCCIWRYHPVTQRFEIWADGTINPWGLDWNEEGEGFINTSVIDHLWHLVPGARYQRTPGRGTASLNPYSYALMEPTSDHRHWSGGETGRKDFGGNDSAGGGHSHCGMVIYQSSAWPETYRNRAFFSNVLGQRINTDLLLRAQSAWVASHGEDFLKSSNPWFRAVDLRQGPSGEMMIAEWTDLGECHDRDGIHRSSGRLYEVWHGDRPKKGTIDIATKTTPELLKLMYHENVWWRRHARRNIQERIWKGETLSNSQLAQLVTTAKSTTIRDAISAIQILHATGKPPLDWFPEIYQSALNAENPGSRAPVRIHLLTLVFTEETPSLDLVKWLEETIPKENDQRVLYRMAALLQRIPVSQCWNAAEALSRIQIPDADRNFQLMRWYGFEPLVPADPVRAMKTAMEPGHPWLSEAIARRAVDAQALEKVITSLIGEPTESDTLQSIFTGLLQSLPARTTMPKDWSKLYQKLKEKDDPNVRKTIFQLAQSFGDPAAEEEMVAIVLDRSHPASERREYLQMLVSARSKKIAPHITSLTKDPEISKEAIRAVATFPEKDSANRLIQLYKETSDPVILETLASRQDFADTLVDTVIAGDIPEASITAFVARQISMISSKKDTFVAHLGINSEDMKQKSKQLKIWKNRLSDTYLATADPQEGREVFRRTCSACHKLYGEGGEIGPDLTGSGRSDLDYFLINVLFPSEDVAPDYKLVTLTLKDGRTLAGNIVEENDRVVALRQVGNTERIDVSEIVNRQTSDISLMPPGLIETLHREDVRDLFSYLQTTAPLD